MFFDSIDLHIRVYRLRRPHKRIQSLSFIRCLAIAIHTYHYYYYRFKNGSTDCVAKSPFVLAAKWIHLNLWQFYRGKESHTHIIIISSSNICLANFSSVRVSWIIPLLLVSANLHSSGYRLSHALNLNYCFIAFAIVGIASVRVHCISSSRNKMRRKFIQTDSKYSVINNRERMK